MTSSSNSNPASLVANSATMSASNDINPWCLAFVVSTNELKETNEITFYADSAASHHFFVDRTDFETYTAADPNKSSGQTAEKWIVLHC